MDVTELVEHYSIARYGGGVKDWPIVLVFQRIVQVNLVFGSIAVSQMVENEFGFGLEAGNFMINISCLNIIYSRRASTHPILFCNPTFESISLRT
jgi:hypothetical protein